MTKTVGMLAAGALIVWMLVATAGAQAARSVNDGVYSEAQAQRGKALYADTCAACHGDNLEGSGPMPPLAGADFLRNWQGKTVGDLFEKTHTTMPATAPGTLTPEQSAEITAYMLSMSHYPAGSTALDTKMETLLAIKIEAPKH